MLQIIYFRLISNSILKVVHTPKYACFYWVYQEQEPNARVGLSIIVAVALSLSASLKLFVVSSEVHNPSPIVEN